MADTMEIIISAIDSASEVFQSIISSASSMAGEVESAVSGAGDEFETVAMGASEFQDVVDSVDSTSLEALASTLGMDTAEVERLIQAGADMGSLAAGFEETSQAADDLEKEIQDDIDKMQEFGSAGDVAGAQTFMDIANGLKDTMLGAADSAGTYSDSVMRAGLEAQGAGISAEDMTQMVNNLSDATGRAGGQIRESFIKATARGVTDMQSFETMMKGAGAQATLLGTDIQTMGDKFSSMAQKDTLMARTLAETGITMNELGTAMGMTGATADEVKDKWKELDTNQRAAILGAAASMNEGKTANAEYKDSWAGMQEQMQIAQDRLFRLAGSVLLPVLIPAMQLAGDILRGFGDVVDYVMKSPIGGLISVLGGLAGALVIGISFASAASKMIRFMGLESMFTSIELYALALAGDAEALSALGVEGGSILASTGLGAMATSAWAAATAVWALIAPLLPFIAAAALVAVAIFEIGKAFGWWTDAGSMIDAIRSGLMRLWNAFINHPDVQATIQAISNAWNMLTSAIGNAWNAVLGFFGIHEGSNFDIVHEIIVLIGAAWEALSFHINNVINVATAVWNIISWVVTSIWNVISPLVNMVIGAFNNIMNTVNLFRAGQMDLPTFILNILTILWTTYTTILTRIGTFILSWGRQILQRGITAARNFINGILNTIRQLPGRVYTALLGVVGRISSGIQHWINTAKAKVASLISSITGPFSGLAGKISNALSGVIDAITAPFRDAWNAVEPYVSKIKEGIDMIGNIAFGGEAAYGGEAISVDNQPFNISTGEYTGGNEPIIVEQNITLDLVNVPAHIDTATLISMLSDRSVLQALTGNADFQSLDNKMKQRLNLKGVRARGR